MIPFLKLQPVEIYPAQHPIKSDQPLGSVRLFAPLVGTVLDIVLQEMPLGSTQPQRRLRYQVRVQSSEFVIRAHFDGDGWTPEFEGAEVIVGPEPLALTEPFAPPNVHAVQHVPTVCIVVESALGMGTLIGRPWAKTDFKIVKQLVLSLLDGLRDVQVLVMFYADRHPEQPIPPEFPTALLPEEAKAVNGPTIFYLPNDEPRFRHPNRVRTAVETDFESNQTVTSDWYKSMEEAMHALTELPWSESTRHAIWIGQSAPHVYVAEGADPSADRFGFSSTYDFDAQLKATREQGIRHMALFIGEDVPGTGDTLKREARRYWQRIGGDDYFFEIKCSSSEHAMPPQKVLDAFIPLSAEAVWVLEADGAIDLPLVGLPESFKFSASGLRQLTEG